MPGIIPEDETGELPNAQSAPDHHPEGWCPACPHEFTCVGPRSSRSHRKGLRGATPRTRPPAAPPSGRRPRLGRQSTQPRIVVPAPSVKRTPSSNPARGLSEAVPQASTNPALRAFYTPTQIPQWEPATSLPRPQHPRNSTGTLPSCGYPQLGLPRVAQSVLGPARLVSATPQTQPGGTTTDNQYFCIHATNMQLQTVPSRLRALNFPRAIASEISGSE